VSYWVNGNSGKAPHGTAEDGGFIGWTEFGVQDDPSGHGADQWLAAQVRPQVDALTVEAPDLSPGGTVTVEAELVQGGTVMPVGYPMGVDWSGSDDLYIGERPPGPLHWWRYDAWFDPGTRELHAWRAGTVDLTVTVNDAEATCSISVA
jgi:hypothetical protein